MQMYGIQEDTGCGIGSKARKLVNRTLMKVIVNLFAFLEMSDFDEVSREWIDGREYVEPEIDNRIVLKRIEFASATLLDGLTPEERAEFADYIEELAAEREEAERRSAPFYNLHHKEYMDFLAAFASDLRSYDEDEVWRQGKLELAGDGESRR
jgi:hypothetical protein